MNDFGLSNPFTPSFGEVPFVFAGRERLLREAASAFSRPNRSPELTMLVSGARGAGKTALLAKMTVIAEQSGWITVKTVAAPGMLEDIYQHVVRDTAHLIEDGAVKKRITGNGVAQLANVEWQVAETDAGNWRIRMETLLDQIEDAGSGLLIAVDEVDPSVDEMIMLASVYQLMVMDNRRVALLMAGLPYNIEKAKGDKWIPFVRRAQQRRLERVDDFDVRQAIAKTVRQGGRTIEEEALEIAVDAAGGFPFMIQLVGYRMWEECVGDEITVSDARSGAAAAVREMEVYVLESTYRDLSEGDLAFLAAMLQDDGPSTLKDIGKRLGKSSGHVGTYRERLLRAGVIDDPDRNVVGFSLPGFRGFLKRRLA